MLAYHARKTRREEVHQKFGEEAPKCLQEYTRLRAGTGGYNISEYTTN
jgi:hypothetical protein